jgi:hypothetical protein
MFSSMTMASSTTNPTDSVEAYRIAAKVPNTDRGSASAGINVAEAFRSV